MNIYLIYTRWIFLESKLNAKHLKNSYLFRRSLILDVTWSRQHSNINFLHVPPPDATTTIKANVILGSMRSAVLELYQELSVLKSLIEGTINVLSFF